MDELSKETLELYIKDEEERLLRAVDDEYLKGLLTVRLNSYNRLLSELVQKEEASNGANN